MPLAALIALLAASASADTVYLKNGRTMEGMVQSEDKKELVLDIGYGTVTLQRADVARIERAAGSSRAALEKENRLRGFEAGEAIPDAGREVYAAYRTARGKRELAMQSKRDDETTREERSELESELTSAEERYGALGRQLQGLNMRTQNAAYAAVGTEMNNLTVSIHEKKLAWERLGRDLTADEEASRGYLEAYREFRDRLASAAPGLRAAGEAQRDFLDVMAKRRDEMKADFAQNSVSARRLGSHLVVTALANGLVPLHLVVDTGASATVISPEAAARIHIEEGKDRGLARSVVADGRAVEGRAYELDSLSVGENRAAKVLVVALPGAGSERDGVDGLLGMSFLGRFSVELDAEAGRLVLSRLRAPARAQTR